MQCLGPLGRPFTLPDRDTEVWMVAGGVGLAPFATLAETLAPDGVTLTLFYGARRAEELFLPRVLRAARRPPRARPPRTAARGDRGRVTVPLRRALAHQSASARLLIHACGPEPMLAAVAHLAAESAGRARSRSNG